MPKYVIQGGHVVQTSDGRQGEGAELKLTEADAQELGAAVALAPTASPATPPETKALAATPAKDK